MWQSKPISTNANPSQSTSRNDVERFRPKTKAVIWCERSQVILHKQRARGTMWVVDVGRDNLCGIGMAQLAVTVEVPRTSITYNSHSCTCRITIRKSMVIGRWVRNPPGNSIFVDKYIMWNFDSSSLSMVGSDRSHQVIVDDTTRGTMWVVGQSIKESIKGVLPYRCVGRDKIPLWYRNGGIGPIPLSTWRLGKC